MRLIRLFILILLSSFGAYAQNIGNSNGEICATMEQDSISRARFPQRGTLIEFEQSIQKTIAEIAELKKNGKVLAGVVTLPIIVHVVHNGESVGNGTNISQAQVQAQIDVLNEDFRRLIGTPGYNTNPVGADIEIEFCLSPVDENGNMMAEPGIHRYNGSRTDWSRDQIENQLKPNTIWNPNLFYNIWTVRFASSESNLIGYAQFPDNSGLTGLPQSGPAATDGVVIRYQSFGSTDKGNFPVMVAPYNKGRTLTHETGHWLGLRHIWGDAPCGDDFVADTPPADGPSSGCPIGRMSCGATNMVQNYMDYSNDACMNIFTLGQKNRMQAVIMVSPRRKTLVEANLCLPQVADKPVANFYTNKEECVLLGSQVQFNDISSNFPNEWLWEFEGGEPSSSTERNPRIQYNNPGVFNVTLIAVNALGSDTLIVEDLIDVSSEGLCGSFTNFDISFTPSIVNLSEFGNYTGYLTGHNSVKSKAFSEFFPNTCGYKYISGMSVRFGEAMADLEDAAVTFTVWNSRGYQNGPGSVVEQKTVLLKQILDDIANDRPTTVTFDRETPLFSRSFHIGVEIAYNANYSVAITSSANGESTNATSWVQDNNGAWQLMTIAYGANIAMDMVPMVGANLSVQVSASDILAYPGQEIILNGRGASIFVWNSDDGSVVDVTGPQLIVYPMQTTTYTTEGSGLELCNATATTTIYVADNVLSASDNPYAAGIDLYPNPGTDELRVRIENPYTGPIRVSVTSAIGRSVLESGIRFKSEHSYNDSFDTGSLRPGLYIVNVRLGDQTVIKKWIKK